MLHLLLDSTEGQLYVMKGNFKRKIKLTLNFIGIFAGNI